MSSLAKVSWFENIGGERRERSLEANRETLSEKELKEVRDAIWRFIEDGLHKEVEHLSDDEEEAREQMLQVYLVHEVPYQAGNGYDPRRIRDIDYDCCWALLESELGLTPEMNARNLAHGPSIRISIDKEDHGFSGPSGYGFRVTAHAYNPDPKSGAGSWNDEGNDKLLPMKFIGALKLLDLMEKATREIGTPSR